MLLCLSFIPPVPVCTWINPVSTSPLMNSGCSATRFTKSIFVCRPTIYAQSPSFVRGIIFANKFFFLKKIDVYLILLQRPSESSQCIVAILTSNHELGNHGVIVHANLIPLGKPSFDANVLWVGWRTDTVQRSSVWQEVAVDPLWVSGEIYKPNQTK